MTVIREGIERQIQVVIALEIPGQGEHCGEFNAIEGDATLTELHVQLLQVTAWLRVNHQSRSGECL